MEHLGNDNNFSLYLGTKGERETVCRGTQCWQSWINQQKEFLRLA